MAFIKTVIFAALTCALVFSSSGAWAFDAAPGDYIVKYKGQKSVASVSLQTIPGLTITGHSAPGRFVQVQIDPAREGETVAELLTLPQVEYVVPNFKLEAFRSPINAPEFYLNELKAQWAVEQVHAPDAWKRAGNRGSHKVLLAVIDTGVDYNHPALKPNMVEGYDFINDNADAMDRKGRNPGHGTHCAGIAGATGLIDGGVIGISPELSIMPLRFLNEQGTGDLAMAIKAIDFAIAHGVQVISASWGASVPRETAQPLIEAIQRADAAGIIFVTAAGNDGKSNDEKDTFPANAGTANMITVAATDSNDVGARFTNFGTGKVHVAAPGVDILSSLPDNSYGKLSGTSMATPLVAGLVAFLKAQDPSLTGRAARALLQKSGAKAQVEDACHCRVDALAATGSLIDHQMLVVPAAATIKPGDTLQFETTNAKAPITYALSNPAVGAISEAGILVASAAGDTLVTATDADGKTASSLTISVQTHPSGPVYQCPFGHVICHVVCGLLPHLRFCPKH